MIKHATAGAFVFCRFPAEWRLGLVEHPRMGLPVKAVGAQFDKALLGCERPLVALAGAVEREFGVAADENGEVGQGAPLPGQAQDTARLLQRCLVIAGVHEHGLVDGSGVEAASVDDELACTRCLRGGFGAACQLRPAWQIASRLPNSLAQLAVYFSPYVDVDGCRRRRPSPCLVRVCRLAAVLIGGLASRWPTGIGCSRLSSGSAPRAAPPVLDSGSRWPAA